MIFTTFKKLMPLNIYETTVVSLHESFYGRITLIKCDFLDAFSHVHGNTCAQKFTHIFEKFIYEIYRQESYHIG